MKKTIYLFLFLILFLGTIRGNTVNISFSEDTIILSNQIDSQVLSLKYSSAPSDSIILIQFDIEFDSRYIEIDSGSITPGFFLTEETDTYMISFNPSINGDSISVLCWRASSNPEYLGFAGDNINIFNNLIINKKGTESFNTNLKFSSYIILDDTGNQLNGSSEDIIISYYNDNIWYVSSDTGNDITHNGSETFPFQTISKAMSVVSDGDTIIVYSGIYSETVSINNDNISIIGSDSEGINATILDFGDSNPSTNAKGIYAQNQTGIVLANLQIRNSYNGIEFDSVTFSIIENVLVNYNRQYGIFLKTSSDNKLANISISNNEYGFYLQTSIRNELIYNYSLENIWDGFSLNTSSHNNVLSNNESKNNDNGFNLSSSNENILSGNTASENTTRGFYIRLNSNDNELRNNSLSNNNIGLDLQGSNINTIEDNTITNNDTGFYLQTSEDNLFTGNVCSNNDTGFYILSSNENRFINNESYNNNYTGFHIKTSNQNQFINNRIYNNNDIGIYLQSSNGNIITNNTVTNSNNYGILHKSSNNNYLSNNIVFENGFGIFIDDSTGNYYAQNNIYLNNYYGISITSTSSGITFEKNNIQTSVNNPDSAVYNSANSIFNMKYNYWNTTDSEVLFSKISEISGTLLWTPFRLGIVDTGVGADTVAPAAPDIVETITLNDTSIHINWSIVTTDEDGSALTGLSGYRIYRSPTVDTSYWLKIAEVNAATDEFIDSGLSGTGFYFYRVTAFDNNSPYENESWYSDSIVQWLPQPEIEIYIPETGHDTKTKVISIFGTTLNTNVSDTVTIYLHDTGTVPQDIIIIGTSNGAWTGTVELSGFGDTVYVKIEDSFGRTSYDSKIYNYFDMPIIYLTSLTDGLNYASPHDTNVKIITLSGTSKWTKSGDTVQVYLNGVIQNDSYTVLTDYDSSWTLPDITLNDYLNTVVVEIVDNWDRKNSDTIYICSYSLPEIEVFIPVTGTNITNPYDTNIQYITISGTVRNIRNADTILIIINDVSENDSIIEISGLQSIEFDTIFSIEIKLNDFLNTVTAQVSDGFSRQADTTEFIYYYPQSSIIIKNPEQNHDTNVSPVYITIETDTSHIGDTIKIYLLSHNAGGDSVLQSDTILTENNQIIAGTTELTGWGDTVYVSITDRFNRTEWDSITLNYFAEPSVKITTPLTGHDTNVKNISIIGTSKNSRAGDTVEIWTDNKLNTTVIITSNNDNIYGIAELIGYGEQVWIKLNGFSGVAYDTISILYYPEYSGPLWYVSSDTGSDTIAGTGSETYPFQTISTAMSVLSVGDTILILPGTYNEEVNITQTGISIIGGGEAEEIILDGINKTGIGIFADNFDNLTIQNLTIKNYHNGIEWASVTESKIENVIVQNNSNYGFYIHTVSEENIFINNISINNVNHGFYFNESRNNDITNNISCNNRGKGFYFYLSPDLIFSQNTSDSNADYEVHYFDLDSFSKFEKNNIFPSLYDITKGLLYYEFAFPPLSAEKTYWGTIDLSVVSNMVSSNVIYSPFRLGIVDTSVGADIISPASPDTVGIETVSETEIIISWSRVTKNEEGLQPLSDLAGYRIYTASVHDSSYWLNIGEVLSDTEIYYYTGAADIINFYYRVTAFDNKLPYENESWYSDSIILPPPPSIYDGSGSINDPYIIENWEQLNGIRENLSAYYLLTNNLDSSTFDYDTYASSSANGNNGWLPIGNNIDSFAGNFDGSGFAISDININRSGNSYIGLFASNAGNISNLNLYNIFYVGSNLTGGIAGYNTGKINSCFVEGNISAADLAGGLVGRNNVGIISFGYSIVSISGAEIIGGLVGQNSDGEISNSYSFGDVNGSNFIGGFAGWNTGNINNSYSIGNVEGTNFIGGLIGRNTGNVNNSFYDKFTTGQSDINKGIGLSTYEMVQQSTFIGAMWDFVDTWTILENRSYPFFKWQTENIPYATPYSITTQVSPAPVGEIIVSADTQFAGGTVALTATPDAEYIFDYWSVAPSLGSFTGDTQNINIIYNFVDTDVVLSGHFSYDGPIWYVNANTGFDTFLGSETYPFKSITRAMAAVNPGDTVMIAEGTYSETVIIEADNLFIIGDGDSSLIILDGIDSTGTGIFAENLNNLLIRNLTIQNYNSGIEFSGVTNSFFENIIIRNNAVYGIHLRNVSNNNSLNNISGINNNTAIHLQTSNNNNITNNSINNNNQYGMLLTTAEDNLITKNILTNNLAGIQFENSSNNNLFINNISSFNISTGINLNNSSNNYFGQNTIESNTNLGITLAGTSANNTIEKNNILNNSVQNSTGNNFVFTRNWWDTTDSEVISSKISEISGSIFWTPFRLGEVDTGPGADTIAPASPDTVLAKALSDTMIQISWSDVIENEEGGLPLTDLSGYRIYRSLIHDTSYWEKIGDVTSANLVFTDIGLMDRTTYYYRITAYDDKSPFENESWYSDDIASDTTWPPYPLVEIKLPETGYDTIVRNITVSGTAENLLFQGYDTVSIYLNNNIQDTIAVVDINGEWSIENLFLTGIGDIISVKLTDMFGREIWETITVNFFDLPEISITLPEDEHDTFISVISIRGTTLNTRAGDTVIIKLNNEVEDTVILNGLHGNFTGTVTLTEKYNDILVRLTDDFGRTTEDTISVVYYKEPLVKIISPETEHDTMSKIINVYGTTGNTRAGDIIEIWTNNVLNTTLSILNDDDPWSGTAELAGEGDSVWVRLIGFSGTVYDTITVNYLLPQQVGIINPLNNSDTFIKNIIVSGTSHNSYSGDTYYIYLIDEMGDSIFQYSGHLTVQDGNWSGTVELNGIGDTIYVLLENRLGGLAYDSIIINYLDDLSIAITLPLTNQDTMSSIIAVSGTTYNSKAGDTVYLYLNNNPVPFSFYQITGYNDSWNGTVQLSGIADSVIAVIEQNIGGDIRTSEYEILINWFDYPSVKIKIPDENTTYITPYNTTADTVILNGTTVWTKPGDSVRVSVNEVLQPEMDIIQGLNGDWLLPQISLDDYMNTVVVEIKDNWDRTDYDTIYIFYYPPPQVKIMIPHHTTYDTLTETILIEGTSFNTYSGDTVEIYLNGIYIDNTLLNQENDDWSISLTLTGIGDEVSIKLTDGFNRVVWDTITINYFAFPEIDILLPSPETDYNNPYLTNTKNLIVSGTVSNVRPGDTVIIKINDTIYNDSTFILNQQGEAIWNIDILLNDFLNTAVLTVYDGFGRFNSDTIFIYYYPASNISITHPEMNIDTFTQLVTIYGTTDYSHQGDTVTLYVLDNFGNPVYQSLTVLTDNNGSWSGTVQLNGLGNVVLAGLENIFSDIVYDSIIINYLDDLSVGITVPANNHDTYISIININGTSLNSKAGDTIYIFVNNNLTPETYFVIADYHGNWSGTAELTGLNDTLSVELHQNIYGDTRSSNHYITVNLFYYPVIEITSPAVNTTYGSPYGTINDTVIISGTSEWTKPGDEVRIYINEVLQAENTLINEINGNWELPEISLNDYLNTVVVELTDNWNRSQYDTIYIFYYPAPDIKITIPDLISYDTVAQEIMIGGTTFNTYQSDTVEIFLNGVSVSDTFLTLDNGNWISGNILLEGIGDIISVKLTDSFDRVVWDTITVNYFSLLSLRITDPADGTNILNPLITKNPDLTLSGTVSNVRIGDSIIVKVIINDIIYSDSLDISVTGDTIWTIEALLDERLNTVTVEVQDRFGRTDSDTRFIYLQPLPLISIMSPETNHDTASQSVKISGTTFNTLSGDTVEVYVNNIFEGETNITEIDGNWEYEIGLTNIGDNIRVNIIDSFGRITSDSIIINYFNIPEVNIDFPFLISSYFDPYKTNIKNITIGGTVSNIRDNDSITVYINDILYNDSSIIISTRGDTDWYVDITLDDFLNTVVIIVNDNFGRSNIDTGYIYYYPSSAVSISHPPINTDTFIQTVNVSGASSFSHTGDTVYLFVEDSNGNYIYQSQTLLISNNGDWSGTVVLNGLSDTVMVVLENIFGDTVYDTVILNYLPQLSVSINFPEYNHDTFSIQISVSGTTKNSRLGDTVYLYVNANSVYESYFIITEYHGNWNGTVQLTDIGDTVTAILEQNIYSDTRGAEDEIIVNRFNWPELSVLLPDTATTYLNPHDTLVNIVNISGTSNWTKPGDYVSVYINNILQNETSVINTIHGNWNLESIQMNDYLNTVVVQITDNWSRQNTDTVFIYCYPPPDIKITIPDAVSYDTIINEIIVGGTSKNTYSGDTVEIYVNGIFMHRSIIPATDNDWSGTAALSSIGDIVSVRVIGRFNREAWDTITVNYFDDLSIHISEPVAGTDIIEPIITDTNLHYLSGTVSNVRLGDTIIVNVNGIDFYDSIITISAVGDTDWIAFALLDERLNTVVIQVFDAFGRIDYDTRYFYYQLPPKISILSPVNNYDTVSQVLLLSGTTYNSIQDDIIQIYVNNILQIETDVVSPDASWIFEIILSGINDTITAVITDRFSRPDTNEIILNYFAYPEIKILSPFDESDYNNPYKTNNNNMTLSGTVSSVRYNDTITVTINGSAHPDSDISITARGDTEWSFEILLDDFLNTVVIEISDNFGRYNRDTGYIYYYPPSNISITHPEMNIDTFVRAVYISGTTDTTHTGDTIYLYIEDINGIYHHQSSYILISNNGNWSGTVLLNGLSDTIIAVHENIFGDTVADTITINYYADLSIAIEFPENGHDTLAPVIYISGTTLNTKSGDTIYLYINLNTTPETYYVITGLNGDWNGTVELTGIGDTVRTVVEQNIYGDTRTAENEIRVNLFYMPEISLTSPATGTSYGLPYETISETVILSGTTNWTKYGDMINVYLNGNLTATDTMLYQINSGWSLPQLFLDDYLNTVVVEVKDIWDRTDYDTIYIFYYPPPEIKILIPDILTYDTIIKNIDFSGTTFNTYTGDSVDIFVNGVLNFNTELLLNDGVWSGTGLLNGINDSVAVKLTDGFGRTVWDTITVNYFDTLTLQITNPENGLTEIDPFIVMNSITPLSGTASNVQIGDTITATVYKEGIIHSTSMITITGLGDTIWTINAVLDNRLNTVVIEVNDQFGRTFSDTRFIFLQPLPDIAILYPENNHDTMTQIFTIYGTTDNTLTGDTVQIHINDVLFGETNIVNSDGIWEYEITLSGLSDIVRVTIIDRFNRHISDELTLNYFAHPQIDIQLPSATSTYSIPYLTNLPVVSISGEVDNVRDNDTISMTVNGLLYPDSTYIIAGRGKINWSIDIALSDFLNSAVVEITDSFGRTHSDTIFIYFYPTSALFITYPSMNYDTFVQTVSVGGISGSSHSGDTVRLFVLEPDGTPVFQSKYLLTENNGSWSGTIQLNGIGDTVMAEIENIFGDKISTVTVLNFLGDLSVGITVPEMNHDTASKFISVRGTTKNTKAGDTVYLFVNDNLVPYSYYVITDYNDNWHGTVELSGVGDSVIAYVEQYILNDGRNSDNRITVNYYMPPEIVISHPYHGFATTESPLSVSGYSINVPNYGSTIRIYINNVLQAELTDQQRNWSYPLPVSEKHNLLRIELIDVFNRLVDEFLTFHFYNIWFVSPSGNDNNPGSAALPFRTIGKAMNVITEGETVIIRPGAYNESVTISGDEIFIIGEEASNVILNAGSRENAGAIGFSFSGINNVLIENITVRNALHGIYINNSSNIKLRNLIVKETGNTQLFGNGSAITLLNSNDNSITNVTVEDNFRGICLFNSTGNVLNSNRALNHNSDGFFIGNSSNGNSLFNNTSINNSAGFSISQSHNTILNFNTATNNINNGFILTASTGNTLTYNSSKSNQRSGIYLISSSNNNLIRNNLSSNNSWYGIYTNNSSNINISFNEISGNELYQIFNTGLNVQNYSVTNNNILTNPGNPNAAVSNNANFNMNFTNNWWDTVDDTEIQSKIQGTYDNRVNYSPFRLSYVDTGIYPPSMADVIITDTNIITVTNSDFVYMTNYITNEIIIIDKTNLNKGITTFNLSINQPSNIEFLLFRKPTSSELYIDDLNDSQRLFVDFAFEIRAYSGQNDISSAANLYNQINVTTEFNDIFIPNVQNETIRLFKSVNNVWSRENSVIIESSDTYVSITGLNILQYYYSILPTSAILFTMRQNFVPVLIDLEDAVIVPNPFRPNDGNDNTGKKFSGSIDDVTNRTGIHIYGITDNTNIEIYDILGRRIRTIRNIEGQNIVIWDVKDKRGNNVGSGTYFFIISNPTQRVIKKLAIIK